MDNASAPSVMNRTGEIQTLQIKIIYWGPGEAGKTTNFRKLKQIFSSYLISKGFSIETSTHRTLWNDSIHFCFQMPMFNLELITILTTSTGQKRFLSTREYVLQNTDGVVFVADSNPLKMPENKRSFEELLSFCGSTSIPIKILLNKRDLANAISVEDLCQLLEIPLPPSIRKSDHNPPDEKMIYESVAIHSQDPGEVKDVFLDLIQEILKRHFVTL